MVSYNQGLGFSTKVGQISPTQPVSSEYTHSILCFISGVKRNQGLSLALLSFRMPIAVV